MKALATRAALLSLSRIANLGLLLISPVILVRLLSVEDFGRYREFILYSTIMQGLAGMLINSSLLTFVPAHPQHTWQFVRQAVILVAASSVFFVAALFVLDTALNGVLVGDYLMPVAAYTILFVNFDFWQFLWLAQKKSVAVVAYATGRLFARVLVVVIAAAISGDVIVIAWSLAIFELCRVFVSAISWIRYTRSVEETPRNFWRDQIRFCAPLGVGNIVGTLNSRAAHLVVAKHGGPAALAEFSIGTYVEPIVSVIRNSLSEVLLPELVARQAQRRDDPLHLWRRATVVNTILLAPAAVILAKYADLIITTLFSEDYRGAVPVFQIYLLILLRECFDFGVLLRAVSQTKSFLQNNVLSLAINLCLLALLVPLAGVVGAIMALVIARFCEGLYLGWHVCRLYKIAVGDLIPWRELGKVCIVTVLASSTLIVPFSTGESGWGLAIARSIAFFVAFVALLLSLRVSEAVAIWTAVRRFRWRASTGGRE